MKKIISLLVVLTVVLSALGAVSFAQESNVDAQMRVMTAEDNALNNIPDEMKERVLDLMDNGVTVYYGEGTTSPSYLNTAVLTRSIPTAVTNLPASAAVFDYDMTYGNVYYSPSLLRATQACKMKIYRTCTTGESAHMINLKVIDKTTGGTVFNNDVTVDYPGTTLSIPLTASHDYYIVTTPLTSGSTKIAYVISGE